ncbi:MAG TPA: glycerophosphodiester phosphodiesterase [Candidatus Saccharimonadales bacterium]|nr:glycerophosphodiester phosphodiesterase [Candidatus Saccharimonadales bacterium]
MKIIGHRGARGLVPENTVASLLKALDYGVDEVEFDVRVTKDGVPILSHDPDMHDPAGNHLRITGHTYEELLAHKPDLATLKQAIKAIDRRVPMMLEVKPDVTLKPVTDVIKSCLKAGWSATDFNLASYSQPILLELQAELPGIQKIVIENWSGVRAAKRARQLGTKRLSMLEYWLWSGFISAMARRDYKLYSFPPKSPLKERLFSKIGLTGFTNNPKKARRWAKYGLAGVITDFPDRFTKK